MNQVSTFMEPELQEAGNASASLGEYLRAAQRHKTGILVIVGIVIAIGLLLARFLPATYRSTATVLIEQQEIPAALVQSTITSLAAQRIQAITQRVMTRRNLLAIMDATGIYADRRERETTEAVIEAMRQNISLDMIEGPVSGGRGQAVSGTIAFTVSFEGENPKMTQNVANELTTLYLNVNLQERTQAASETLRFLTEESGRLNSQISDLEGRLANFKTEHRTSLPELQSLNIQLMNTTESQLATIDDNIHSMEERILFLEDQLALMDPDSFEGSTASTDAMSPTVRLARMKSILQGLQSIYAPEHPDVQRQKRAIEALEADLQSTGRQIPDTEVDTAAELERLRAELQAASEKYTEGHPDIVRLRNAIEALELQAAGQAAETTPAAGSTEAAPTNPAYLSAQRNLEFANLGLQDLKSRRERVVAKYLEIEQRLIATPQIEREYGELQRDYDNTVAKYREIKSKQLAAQTGQTMEEERKAERFTLIEPATLPEEPIKPNRPMIVILSIMLAFGCAFAYTAAAEALDTSVRGPKGVLRVLNVAPMSVIPYQMLDTEVSHQRRRRLVLLLLLPAVVILALVLIHFLWVPLDVLWFRALRVIGNLIGTELV